MAAGDGKSAVIVITGPSGVGKGTLIAKLLAARKDLTLSVSATTRDPRPGEVDGRDYHFLSDSEFDQRVAQDDFLEWATYSGNRYGTLRSEVERSRDAGRSVVLEIEVEGARQVRRTMPEAIQVFIAPPEPTVLRERLAGRGTDSPEAIEARLKVAEAELMAKDEFTRVIVNGEVESAAAELVRFVDDETR